MTQGKKITVRTEVVGLWIKNAVADILGDMLDYNQQTVNIIASGEHTQALMSDVGGIFGVKDFISQGAVDIAEIAVKQVFVDGHLQ